MVDYTADDGLDILKYLGLAGRLTAEETKIFRREWVEYYKQNSEDPIMTTWDLYYEACSFSMEASEKSLVVSQQRDREFGEKLDGTKLGEDFKLGKNLRDIISKG